MQKSMGSVQGCLSFFIWIHLEGVKFNQNLGGYSPLYPLMNVLGTVHMFFTNGCMPLAKLWDEYSFTPLGRGPSTTNLLKSLYNTA